MKKNFEVLSKDRNTVQCHEFDSFLEADIFASALISSGEYLAVQIGDGSRILSKWTKH